MPLLNLDKIVLNRTILGPSCPVCGGELHAHAPTAGEPPHWWAFWYRKSIFVTGYQCKDCGKRYRLTENKSLVL